MQTAIFLHCYNAYDYLHMQNKNEALWRRVMQMMSPNHEYIIIFVFDLAKSMFFSAFHMKIFGLSFMLGCPGPDIIFFLCHLH